MNRNGLSFLSMLISLIVIAILTTLLLPQFKQTVEKEHTTQVQALKAVQELQQQLNAQTQARERMISNPEGAPGTY